MPNALTPSKPIDLGCLDCVLGRNSLLIANEAGFQQAGAMLVQIDSCSQWWWGDYLAHAETHGFKSVLDQARSDLHRSTIYSYKECARFYAPEDRHPELSFGHHVAVMYCLGVDAVVKEAKTWLNLAATGGLTVGELREQIRASRRAGENDPGPMRGVVRITDFVKVSRWSENVKAADLEPQQAEELRKSTGSLFTFLCELHRKPFEIT